MERINKGVFFRRIKNHKGAYITTSLLIDDRIPPRRLSMKDFLDECGPDSGVWKDVKIFKMNNGIYAVYIGRYYSANVKWIDQ